jgi:hypothetical protein
VDWDERDSDAFEAPANPLSFGICAADGRDVFVSGSDDGDALSIKLVLCGLVAKVI